MATGLGSYNALGLANSLVALAQSASGPRSSPTSTTWYLAEGSVGGGFEEFITIQTPNASQDASVNVTYLFQSRSAVTVTHNVPASTRATFTANQDLGIRSTDPQQAISAIEHVPNGTGSAVIRPRYFNSLGTQICTTVAGATNPE